MWNLSQVDLLNISFQNPNNNDNITGLENGFQYKVLNFEKLNLVTMEIKNIKQRHILQVAYLTNPRKKKIKIKIEIIKDQCATRY